MIYIQLLTHHMHLDFMTKVVHQIRSVAQSCPTLCDPMNHSTPGHPVYHQLLEFTQTHVHRVNDAIQPSHPLSSPSPLAPIPPSIRVFSNESILRMRWPKYWSFSFSIIPFKEIPGLISFSLQQILVVGPLLVSYYFNINILGGRQIQGKGVH